LPLLDGGHSAIAGRLAGALRRVGHAEQAGEILSTMKVAGYDVRESEPFEVTQRVFAKRGATEAPIVGRLQAIWSPARRRGGADAKYNAGAQTECVDFA
jgi:hypothetical protein